MSIHDLERRVARDGGEGDRGQRGVAHHVKNRGRSVNATKTAARCRSHREGPPYDNNEADVEHPGRPRHNRPADRQRRNADERLDNSECDRGGRFGGQSQRHEELGGGSGPNDLRETGDKEEQRGGSVQRNEDVHDLSNVTRERRFAANARDAAAGMCWVASTVGYMPDERADFYDLIARNRRRTWLLMFAFFMLLAVVAATVSLVLGGGIIVAVIAIAISFGITVSSYFKSDTLALRSTRAQPADPREFSQLHNLVAEVSLAAGIPSPRVYVVHDPSPNAFATGRNLEHAAVAVTTGLMDKMSRAELEGVIAHEIAHIRNGDILVMTVAVATAGSIALIADIFWRMLYFGALTGGGASHRRRNDNNGGGPNPIIIIGMVLVAVLAPMAAGLLRAAVSRSRESLADATAVEITRNPAGLRKALEKLDADITVVSKTSHATSHLWIESPDDHETQARGRKFNDMFSTHPPLSERINILRAMEGLPPYEGPDPKLAESLRTMQDDRSHPEAAASAAPGSALPGVMGSALPGVNLNVLFPGMGEVAPSDEDPNHAAAGWYHDPEVADGAIRYWDGHEWTDHRHHIPDRNHMAPDGARRSRLPRPPRRRG